MIFVYNPTCEMAVRQANATYQPPKHLAQFESDLAGIMMFLSGENDYVVAQKPDSELLALWDKCNKTKFCDAAEAKRLIINGERLKPWGECKQIFKAFGDEIRYKAFDDEKRRLHSRLSSVELENALCDSALPDYAQHAPLSQLIENKEIAEQAISIGNCVVKSAWSSSGRGVLMVREKEHVGNAIAWAADKIATDGCVIVERLLDRVCEFSFLFDIIDSDNVNYLGINYFEADSNGHFGDELIGHNPMQSLGFVPDWDQPIAAALSAAIRKLGWIRLYHGFVGVDSMAYASGGRILVRPCVEVNMRTCMGNVNVCVSDFFAKNTKSKWRISHFAADGEWNAFCAEQALRNPLKINAEGKIESGFYRLTSSGGKNKFGAWGIAATN
ncbi:MAG: hypothetical protein J6Y82_10130 [Bacteroidales bacterium]|nr:hypothetical protein [Bacteroidales bacterium]